MGLSSNTLVHLTIKKQSLIDILRMGFKLKYCYENVVLKDKGSKGAYPMVCFSDIPLSELKGHIKSYGNYGIGLKKEWAKKNGLNPVLYLDQDSNLSELINKDFKNLFNLTYDKKIDNKFHTTLIHILSYIKNYEGKLKTAKIEIDNYRFSDEREWRYVPSNDLLGEIPNWVPLSEYDTAKKKNNVNKNISEVKLTFTPDDINYVFVEREDEISDFIDIIRKANKKSSFESVERLMSRIITTAQIQTDI